MIWTNLPAPSSRTATRFVPLREWLDYSYGRCIAAGVSRELAQLTILPAAARLSPQCSAVAAYARLLFTETHECLSDQRALLLLTDADGTIIELYARPELQHLLARHHGIMTGVRLAEEACGTNSVILSLRHRTGVALRGDQHYCRIFRSWYSVTMPLISHDGCNLGSVSMAMKDGETAVEGAALVKFLADDINRFCSAHQPISGSGNEPRLTRRQLEVLHGFAQGMSYKEIARVLGVRSVKTVEDHLDAVRVKLNVSCRRECIRRAAELGLLRI